MTTELEKQFFDTFGIEPYDRYYNCKDNLEGECTIENTCCCCDKSEDVYCYPDITDRILLELICILTKRFDYGDQNWLTKCTDTKELKVSVLRLLSLFTTSAIEKYKQQVQALFKE